MGAWGHGAFENDDASDWLADLAEFRDLSLIGKAFDAVVSAKGKYLEARDCCNALAAAEAVAALLGRPATQLPTNLTQWVVDKPRASAALAQKASSALDAVLEDSELKELWAETDDFAAWKSSITELKDRLA